MQTSLAVVLLGCIALASGRCCSEGDADIVIKQWASVMNAAVSGENRVVIGRQIFNSLFLKQPAAPALFPYGSDLDGAEFGAQMSRVLSGLSNAINSLTDDDLNVSIMDHLNKQHVVRDGVTAAAMKDMQVSIEDTLKQLVTDYNDDAWHDCLGVAIERISVGLPA
uniref:Extracellular globin n=1 Tax=Galathealinum brachiosum TaxID=53701 RepID=A0A0S2MLM2_9ANNE|nr:hemoglobin subunit B1 [Galathealinum brachiosum]